LQWIDASRREWYTARGAQLIDETPYLGLHHSLVAFVHPKSMQGVLVELVQHQE
jgi:hypothetical protein